MIPSLYLYPLPLFPRKLVFFHTEGVFLFAEKDTSAFYYAPEGYLLHYEEKYDYEDYLDEVYGFFRETQLTKQADMHIYKCHMERMIVAHLARNKKERFDAHNFVENLW